MPITKHSFGHMLLCGAFCMSFIMKALTAAAWGLCWSDIMIMLYKVMLWLCYGCVMIGYGCFGCWVSQERAVLWLPCQSERINVCSSYSWSHFLPAFSSRLATTGSANSAHSEIQRDNWHCEQDQQYRWDGEMGGRPKRDEIYEIYSWFTLWYSRN